MRRLNWELGLNSERVLSSQVHILISFLSIYQGAKGGQSDFAIREDSIIGSSFLVRFDRHDSLRFVTKTLILPWLLSTILCRNCGMF